MMDIYIDNAPLGSGKTTRAVQAIACHPTKGVCIVPAYDQLNRFEAEWTRFGDPNKKVVILSGKRRVCLRNPDVRINCGGCPYNKIS